MPSFTSAQLTQGMNITHQEPLFQGPVDGLFIPPHILSACPFGIKGMRSSLAFIRYPQRSKVIFLGRGVLPGKTGLEPTTRGAHCFLHPPSPHLPSSFALAPPSLSSVWISFDGSISLFLALSLLPNFNASSNMSNPFSFQT